MEEKKARQKCRQGSIFGAFAAAADRSRGQAEKRCLADELPMPLKQKILANLPSGALGDARAVSASWRDAVDDEAFLRFAKMAAHLRGWAHNAGRNKNQNRSDLSSDEDTAARENDDEGFATSATTPALVARREAHADWFRERGVVNAAGVVRFLASHASNPSRRPFATPLACEALVDALRRLADGSATFTPQDHAKASYAPKVEKEHGVIDWNLPAVEVDLLVRAMTPKPGAQTRLGNKRFIVIEGTVEQDLYGMGIPGALQSSGEEGIRVCTGKDLYRITRIKPDNGRNMTAGEFVRGHSIAPDARFG